MPPSEHVRDLGELDDDWGMSEIRWQRRSMPTMSSTKSSPTEMPPSAAMFSIDESTKTAHVWHVRRSLPTRMATTTLASLGDVDLDATQDDGEVIFKNYRVGFIEDLLED